MCGDESPRTGYLREEKRWAMTRNCCKEVSGVLGGDCEHLGHGYMRV
jgi:hypothetical protein